MDLSDAYANSAHIPGGPEFPARWAAQAADFRAAHPPVEIRTGEGERDWLHLYRPRGTPRGLCVIVHGGYWMAFSPMNFSHLAAGALERGWAVAMPCYPLCPEGTVAGIVQSVARAVDRAAQEIAGPIVLTGHSAGGHIVARLAGAGVPLECRDRIAGVVSVSPLSNLVPLLRTGLNATLRLDLWGAVAESPLLHPRPAAPVTVWVGAKERPAFLDQALWLSRAWDAALVVEPGRHHFDVIAGLEQPDHPLTEAVLGRAEGRP